MTSASGPSTHLSWRELACRDRFNTPYPLDWRTDPTRAPALAEAFESVRSECSVEVATDTGGVTIDCPLTVLEGFRTEAYQEMLRQNPRYKAAKNSQHCAGRAVDVACPRMLSFAQFKDCVLRAASKSGSRIRYIEFRPSMNYIHFDVRPTARLVTETID